MSAEKDELITLFDGDPNDKELIQIWRGKLTKEIHIMINGNFLFVLDGEGLTLLKNAVTIAEIKNNAL